MRQTALNMVYELAKQDPRVVFIGSDLGQGTLQKFKQEMPERFFMEGISEAQVIGMSAGLALEGKIVYINTIATFLTRRCFEQVVLDGALHKTRIRLIASGGGLVYAPLGPTHLAIEDIAILRAIPGMTILAPCDADEMQRLMPQTLEIPGPVYIRVAKGGDPIVSKKEISCSIGKGLKLRDGKDALVVTTGITLKIALDAAAELSTQGIQISILHLPTIKPLDVETLAGEMSSVPVVVTIEEHSVIGGLGSAVAEVLGEANFEQTKRFKRIGIPDVFPNRYGSQAQLLDYFGINSKQLVDTLGGLCKI